MAKTLIVVSRVRELANIDGQEMNVSAEIFPRLSKKVERMIAKACYRAKANKRNTIMIKDL